MFAFSSSVIGPRSDRPTGRYFPPTRNSPVSKQRCIHWVICSDFHCSDKRSKHISKPFRCMQQQSKSSQSSLLISLSMPLFAQSASSGSSKGSSGPKEEKLPHFHINGFQSCPWAHFITAAVSSYYFKTQMSGCPAVHKSFIAINPE